ncbi:hypothetical protein KI387_007484, partial [Taxus chinensis]
KVIAKATNEYKRLIEEEERDKKEVEADKDLEEAYQQILLQDAQEGISAEDPNPE